MRSSIPKTKGAPHKQSLAKKIAAKPGVGKKSAVKRSVTTAAILPRPALKAITAIPEIFTATNPSVPGPSIAKPLVELVRGDKNLGADEDCDEDDDLNQFLTW